MLYPHPNEIMNFTESEKQAQRENARNLLAALQSAQESGARELIIAPGYYRFGDPSAPRFLVDGAENLNIIGGEGVELLQETRGTVVMLRGCKNVTLKGVKIDYTLLSFVQCTIAGFNDAGEPIFTVDDNYKLFFEKYRAKLIGSRILYYDGNDPSLELVSSNTRGFVREIVDLEDGKYQLYYKGQITTMLTPLVDYKVGDKLVLFCRGGDHAVAIEASEKVTLEDVDIYTSGAFGLSEHSCIGGNTYRRLRMIRRPGTDRLVCAPRDGFHSQNVKIGALIDECEFSYAEDDLLNAHCFNGVITEIYSPDEYEVTFPLNAGLDANTDMVFISRGEITPVKAIEVEKITDADKIKSYESLNESIKATIDRSIRTFNAPNIYRVKIDKSLDASLYDEVTSSGYSSAGLVIRNSYFHDAHCMAVIATGPNVTVENCRFERIGGTSVSLVRGGFWSEGPYPTYISVKNNIFKDCATAFEAQYRPGVITIQCDTKGLIHDIDIQDNEFKNIRVGALFAKNASHISFTNNRVDGFLKEKPFDEGVEIAKWNGDAEAFCGIYFDGCDTITLKDNTVSGGGEYSMEDIRITDSCTNVEI